ncbi:ATP-binding response regulator [Desulfonatronum thiodismutans]|uniref:ATP-binding response regulator n=1 Tax=Desulfonatronum thiodismutans TaxID=159290 RepID=UPI00068E7244|nr:response regulator [Desulfonatronum thiodismutans]
MSDSKSKPTIMVVDDNPASLNPLQDLLQQEGYCVELFPRGETAIMAAVRHPPDLILLDIVLPEMDGFETCKRLKQDARLKDIPVLFVSSQAGTNEDVRAFAAGAADFVAKPFHPSVLIARVKTHLHLHRVQKETEADIQQRSAELHLAHQEIYQILSSIQLLLVVLDEQNIVTRWNWVAAKLLRLPYEKAFGKEFDALPVTWEQERVAEAIRSCRENRAAVRVDNLWFELPDGTNGFLMLHLDPILDIYKSEVGGVLILGEDKTEQKMLESQLLQGQKLEAIGQLAAGIAHEINTPIQFVGDNLQFLGSALNDLLPLLDSWLALTHGAVCGDEFEKQTAECKKRIQEVDVSFLTQEIPQAITQSMDGLERVADIVRSMKAFSHPGKEHSTLVDVNKILEHTVTISCNEWKYVAEMDVRLAPDLPSILGHPSELGQAFLNIVINAVHAIAQTHSQAAKSQGRISITSCLDQEWIEIRISDSGGGIPKEIQGRIFDPFFTTKDVGKGTGQGLVIAHSAIVKRHKGTITFKSKANHGTTFIVRLPLMEDMEKKIDTTQLPEIFAEREKMTGGQVEPTAHQV